METTMRHKLIELFEEEKAYGATNQFEHFLHDKVDFGLGSCLIKSGVMGIVGDTVNMTFTNRTTSLNPSTPPELKKLTIELWTDKIIIKANGKKIDTINNDIKFKIAMTVNTVSSISVESIETGEQNNKKRFAFELARKFITTHKIASVKPGKTQYENSKSDGGCFKIIFVPDNADALDWMMAFNRSQMVTDSGPDSRTNDGGKVEITNKLLAVHDGCINVFHKLLCNKVPKMFMREITKWLERIEMELPEDCYKKISELGMETFMSEDTKNQRLRERAYKRVEIIREQQSIVRERIAVVKSLADGKFERA
jgi:hypothetical protein